MGKRIVYLATDSGIDGMARSTIAYASFDEDKRDELYESDKNKAWLTKKEIIVDIEPATQRALGKLDALDALLLNIKIK
jgi:hypothetical protein